MSEGASKNKQTRSPIHNSVELSLLGWNAAMDLFGAGPRAVALWQIEMMGLTNRYVRAYADFTRNMMRCRSTDEVSAEQSALITRTAEDFAQSSEHILNAWVNTGAIPVVDLQGDAQSEHQFLDFSMPYYPPEEEDGINPVMRDVGDTEVANRSV